jgi:hypothetical protein
MLAPSSRPPRSTPHKLALPFAHSVAMFAFDNWREQPGYRSDIEAVIRGHISYTNFIGELAPELVNSSFAGWLDAEVRRN